MVLNDNGMESYVFPVSGGGGGSAKPEQTKTVNVTENGTQTVTPDSGYTLSGVTINTNVPAPPVQTQEKAVQITSNGYTEVVPDSGEYLSLVGITTNVAQAPTQEKTVSISENTTTVIAPNEGNVLSEVTVLTTVPSKFTPLVAKTITSVTGEDLYGLTTIGEYAFYGCENLTSITVPSSVTSIGDYALQCGTSLNKVTITMLGSTPPTIQTNTLLEGNINSIIVPYGALATYQSASIWSNFSSLMSEAPAPPSSSSFAADSWAQIEQACLDGSYKTVYQVGDTKDIELSTGETITVAIMGFDHDDLADGSGKAPITLGMPELLATTYPMNSTETNEGGWNGCLMRTSTMPTLLTRLPADLQGIIKQAAKKTVLSPSETIISNDKLFLLALSEIFSETSLINSSLSDIAPYASTYMNEGVQYEYFTNLIGDNGGGTAQNSSLIKHLGGDGGASQWSLRSSYLGYSTFFWSVSNVGAVASGVASNPYGVCFGFCI